MKWWPAKSRSGGGTAAEAAPPVPAAVRLAIQKALVGQITPAMRLVSVECGEDSIRVVVYFDRALSTSDREEFCSEITDSLGLELGDPPAGPAVDCFFLRCDEPQRVPVRGEIVFARKGVAVY